MATFTKHIDLVISSWSLVVLDCAQLGIPHQMGAVCILWIVDGGDCCCRMAGAAMAMPKLRQTCNAGGWLSQRLCQKVPALWS